MKTNQIVSSSSRERAGSHQVSSRQGRAVGVMAVATGVVIANLYYAQPLEAVLGAHFSVPATRMGLVVTVLQAGYAVGLAFILPLGDVVERRGLLTGLLAGVAAAMGVMAWAPSLPVFVAAAAVVGVTCVAVQVMVPFAAHLAPAGGQARAVSTVISGLLLGILASRTVAGFVAGVAGWRAVFGLGVAATVVALVALRRYLPALPPEARIPYPRLLASVVSLVREHGVLRARMLYGASSFAAFSAFWTSITFILSGPGYRWGTGQIGAFALLGVAGALMAKGAGRLADAGHGRAVTGAGLAAMALATVPLYLGVSHLAALAAGAVLLDLGAQGVHISNQAAIFPLAPAARSRLNTAYMVAYFIGGATGSAASATLYAHAGWPAVCALTAALPLAALACWALTRSERS